MTKLHDVSFGSSNVQDDILYRLKYATSLRYRDLRSKLVPNDLFNYHLQHLVKKGLIEKKGPGYSLSNAGARHIADPLPTHDPLTSLFKVNVITVLSRVHAGRIEILNQKRTTNPSFGKIGVMGGIVSKAEPLEFAANRKLREETGLNARFKIVGIERRMLYKSGGLFSDVLFPIAYADTYSGELMPETKFGKNFWAPITQAIRNDSGHFDSIPSVVHVLRAIKKGTVGKIPFFFEENIQSDI